MEMEQQQQSPSKSQEFEPVINNKPDNLHLDPDLLFPEPDAVPVIDKNATMLSDNCDMHMDTDHNHMSVDVESESPNLNQSETKGQDQDVLEKFYSVSPVPVSSVTPAPPATLSEDPEKVPAPDNDISSASVPLDPLFAQVLQDLRDTQTKLELLAQFVQSKFAGDPKFPKELMDTNAVVGNYNFSAPESPTSPPASTTSSQQTGKKNKGKAKKSNSKSRNRKPPPRTSNSNKKVPDAEESETGHNDNDYQDQPFPSPSPAYEPLDFDDNSGSSERFGGASIAPAASLAEEQENEDDDEDFDIEITNLEILGENLSDSDGPHPCPTCPHLAESSLELKIHTIMNHCYVKIQRLTDAELEKYQEQWEARANAIEEEQIDPEDQNSMLVSSFLAQDFFSLLNASPDITIGDPGSINYASIPISSVGNVIPVVAADPTRYVPTHQKYSCGHCSRDFRSYQQLQKHVLSHKAPATQQPRAAPSRPQSRTREEPQPQRQSRTPVKFNCPKPNCSQSYASPAHLAKHLDDHAKKECPHCGKYFSRPYALRAHLLTHAAEKAKANTNTPKKPPPQKSAAPASAPPRARHIVLPIHKCTVCQRAFTQPTSLRIHMESHEAAGAGAAQEAALHACKGCGKKFRFENTLRGHMDSCAKITGNTAPAAAALPESTPQFTCSICQRSYTQVSSRNRHMRDAHGWEISAGNNSTSGSGGTQDLNFDDEIENDIEFE